jgi:hypothetical protein
MPHPKKARLSWILVLGKSDWADPNNSGNKMIPGRLVASPSAKAQSGQTSTA